MPPDATAANPQGADASKMAPDGDSAKTEGTDAAKIDPDGDAANVAGDGLEAGAAEKAYQRPGIDIAVNRVEEKGGRMK